MTASNTLHYGIITDPDGDGDYDPPNGFSTDGDSFLDWGGERDRTLHIQTPTTYSYPGDYDSIRRLIEDDRVILSGYLKTGQRLVDYVVVTDREDWSENAHVWLIDGSIT